MPDYNPDRESHVKHKYIVQKAMPEANLGAGVLTSKGVLKPDDKGRMLVNDPALANEIRTQYPHELVVTRARMPGAADTGHNYFFGSMPALPWAKYDSLGRRIWDTEPPEEAESLQAEEPAEVPETQEIRQ